jgi:hypothetical protein
MGNAPSVPSEISIVNAAFNGLNASIKNGSEKNILTSLFIISALLFDSFFSQKFAA